MLESGSLFNVSLCKVESCPRSSIFDSGSVVHRFCEELKATHVHQCLRVGAELSLSSPCIKVGEEASLVLVVF